MSVLIKGIDIPKCCNECTLKHSIKCKTHTGYHHQDTNRASKCPIVEVQTPHGKLIDADALDASILQAGFAYALTRRKLRYTAGDVRQKIANAPTIIEADKDENGFVVSCEEYERVKEDWPE